MLFLIWRTALASALACLIPLYFGIGPMTLGLPVHGPELPLDRAMGVAPAWMLVYGSLYVFAFLPLLVVRQRELFRRAMKAYVMVLGVAYVGFVLYPTIAPRPPEVPADGFAAWSLRNQYSIDQRYNCFPSLHVAHSFVSALTAFRVHAGVGIAGVLWAALIGLSIVYTKQHYVVDALAGALAAYAAYLLFLRSHPRGAAAESERRGAPVRALGVVAIYGMLDAGFWAAFRMGL